VTSPELVERQSPPPIPSRSSTNLYHHLQIVAIVMNLMDMVYDPFAMMKFVLMISHLLITSIINIFITAGIKLGALTAMVPRRSQKPLPLHLRLQLRHHAFRQEPRSLARPLARSTAILAWWMLMLDVSGRAAAHRNCAGTNSARTR
jgi:hypothetical protein